MGGPEPYVCGARRFAGERGVETKSVQEFIYGYQDFCKVLEKVLGCLQVMFTRSLIEALGARGVRGTTDGLAGPICCQKPQFINLPL